VNVHLGIILSTFTLKDSSESRLNPVTQQDLIQATSYIKVICTSLCAMLELSE
jgi:hypothetical protein